MKVKTLFTCQECGAKSPRWEGRCSSCGNWNTLVEESVSPDRPKAIDVIAHEQPVLLNTVDYKAEKRYLTSIKELDNVLGGGIVPGSVTLIGGDPGIGKSTLSLQIACSMAAQKKKVLYVSGEESVQQTKMRSSRLSTEGKDDLYIVHQVDLNAILEFINKMKPDIVVVDSIQVVYQPEISSAPGSVSQVRECSAILTHTAKSLGTALFIIGHVTKDGAIAGPRVLEHIVDTVLYFEGERYSSYRVLRAIKNRFGSTNEIGVFEMLSEGLVEVANPSEMFLAERSQDSSGSVVVPILEGTRPFLVEVQGLVTHSNFNMVRQKAQGFDTNRLSLLIAVLEKRQGLHLQDQDVFLNIVGGVKVIDPAADLSVIMAIASSYLDKPVPEKTIVLGEVGLAAEVRSVSHIALRIKEAEKLGFKKCLIPENNLTAAFDIKKIQMEVCAVKNVKQALEIIS